MRFDFLEGAPFTTADLDAHRMVAVINESTRRKFFGDGARAVGRTIEVDGQRFQVMGVVRDVPILRLVPFADIWVPYTTDRSDNYRQEIVGDMMGLFLARSTRRPAGHPERSAIARAARASRTIRRPSRRSRRTPKRSSTRAARVVATGGDAEVENPGRRLWIVLAVAGAALHAAAGREPREPERQPHHGARLRDRRAEVVRRLVARCWSGSSSSRTSRSR